MRVRSTSGALAAASAINAQGAGMRVRVLDGGVIGVTSARYLAKAGHELTVIGRQAGPMARGSGRLLADLVSGRATDIDVGDRGIGRYSG